MRYTCSHIFNFWFCRLLCCCWSWWPLFPQFSFPRSLFMVLCVPWQCIWSRLRYRWCTFIRYHISDIDILLTKHILHCHGYFQICSITWMCYWTLILNFTAIWSVLATIVAFLMPNSWLPVYLLFGGWTRTVILLIGCIGFHNEYYIHLFPRSLATLSDSNTIELPESQVDLASTQYSRQLTVMLNKV